MRLNANSTPKPGSQLWGIYYTDREYAREHGDPLRTVIEAPTKLSGQNGGKALSMSAAVDRRLPGHVPEPCVAATNQSGLV